MSVVENFGLKFMDILNKFLVMSGVKKPLKVILNDDLLIILIVLLQKTLDVLKKNMN